MDALESRFHALELSFGELRNKGIPTDEFELELDRIRFWRDSRAYDTAEWELRLQERLVRLAIEREAGREMGRSGARDHLRHGRLWLAARRLEERERSSVFEVPAPEVAGDLECVLEELQSLADRGRIHPEALPSLVEDLENCRRLLGRRRGRLAGIILWSLATRRWEE